ncbi:MAG TPA: bifunctional oligoribonuclease/PAP phosphatase NrnA [Chloroflexi bacterium]|nr:bifunctional oligoribonuclease/PAP phosphatase NrnA [Chloroflexota bacterium]
MWTPIITELNKRQHIIISSHINPDCDALGSELALAYHLKAMGKDVSILNSDPVPPTYQFLDPDNLIQLYAAHKHAAALAQADAIIVVDASVWQRLGKAGNDLSKIKATIICIDHHPDGQPFADFSYVDSDVVATGELIFDLITAMGGEITPLMAQALYAAISTDSGNFRFPKTSPRTHRIIAELLEAGAEPAKVFKLLYEQQSPELVHLEGEVLQNIQLAAEGQLATVGIGLDTLQKYHIQTSVLDGFSNLPQKIAGVKVAIFLVEQADNRVKVSFRSDGSVAVNTLAAHFGGGGHVPAAGATITGALEDVTRQVIKAAEELVENGRR